LVKEFQIWEYLEFWTRDVQPVIYLQIYVRQIEKLRGTNRELVVNGEVK
jgi:hypothetical protein